MPIGAHRCKALSCTGFFRDGLLGRRPYQGCRTLQSNTTVHTAAKQWPRYGVRTPNRTGRDSVLAACQMLSLPLVNACPLCSVQMTNRPWMDAEHAIALAADA